MFLGFLLGCFVMTFLSDFVTTIILNALVTELGYILEFGQESF